MVEIPQEDPTGPLNPQTWPITVHGYRIIRNEDDRFVAAGLRHRAALRVEVTGPIRLLDLLGGQA